MQSLSLKCNLQRCNIDGTMEMSVDKCVLNIPEGATSPSPCYYLSVRVNDEGTPNDAWSKFNSFVGDKRKKPV